MSNFYIRRRQAYEVTKGELSTQLLEVFDRLIAWPAPGFPDMYGYRDEDLTGPQFATWDEATILYLLAKHGAFKRPLEIGTAVGWTAAHILTGLPKRVSLTCIDPFVETARGLGEYEPFCHQRFLENMQRAELLDRVNLIVDFSPGCLDEVAPKEGWDFVFLDGWHEDGHPQRDVEGLIPHLSGGAIVVLHDLYHGDVHAAGEILARNGWLFTGFFTPNQICVFWKGTSKDEPSWWGEFLAEVPERDTAQANPLDLLETTPEESLAIPEPESPKKHITKKKPE